MALTGNFVKRIPVHITHQELGIHPSDPNQTKVRADYPATAGPQSQTSNTSTTEGGEQPSVRTDMTAYDVGVVPGGADDR